MKARALSSDAMADTCESNATLVNEFHLAVGAPVPVSPHVPSAEALRLRRTLVSEEFREVSEAMDAIDAARAQGEAAALQAVTTLAHELADLLYVTYGGFTDCGIDADAVFAEVHRANLQKARGPKRADGKAMKPPDWKPADVAGVLARQQATRSTE